MKLLKAIKLLVLENLFTRKVHIHNDSAIFSFTFDDAPMTAWTNGARILEKFNKTATFYIATGMDNNKGDNRKLLNGDDILTAHQKGHDIGCHTYSHIDCRKNAVTKVLSDCRTNTTELEKLTGKSTIEHFAYPFGMVGLRSKKSLRSKYLTLRTTDHGVNHGWTDMTHLRSVSLCSIAFTREKVVAAINDAVKHNAWLIFYSHDIRESPSDWGISIEDFEWVVDQCAQARGEILNVSQAYKKIVSA
jgi:peptidoglycan/xylan/chitin deacetylase (PgdA/CDA1 family)